jgi:hypothetical protein
VTYRPTALVVHHAANVYVAAVASMQPAPIAFLHPTGSFRASAEYLLRVAQMPA